MTDRRRLNFPVWPAQRLLYEGCDDGLRTALEYAERALLQAAKAADALSPRQRRKLPFELTSDYLHNEAGRCRDQLMVHSHPSRGDSRVNPPPTTRTEDR